MDFQKLTIPLKPSLELAEIGFSIFTCHQRRFSFFRAVNVFILYILSRYRITETIRRIFNIFYRKTTFGQFV